jgi:hypothetical protein
MNARNTLYGNLLICPFLSKPNESASRKSSKTDMANKISQKLEKQGWQNRDAKYILTMIHLTEIL